MLGRLTPERVVVVDSRGRPTSAGPGGEPSSDVAVHLATYARVPEAQAVVHAHPVHVIALSMDWDAITPPNLEGQLFLPRIPVLDVKWEESAEPIAEALAEHPLVAARAHGVYARGADIWEALKFVSIAEESATILHLTLDRPLTRGERG
jgi:L-fuculose-phosphate aldolase